MDGLIFFDKLMKVWLILVLMIFLFIECGFEVILCVLELGVVDFIVKFWLGIVEGMQVYVEEICVKFKIVVCVCLCCCVVDVLVLLESVVLLFSIEKIIVFGVFIGGIEVFKEVLFGLLVYSFGVVIIQYMFFGFICSFVECLDCLIWFSVSEVCDGDCILFGYVLVVLGDYYMEVQCFGVNYVVCLNCQVQVNGYCLVVDVMFELLVCCVGCNLFVGLFIGMGKDGVCGFLVICQVGGYILVQDEVICVVYGMFCEVVELGVVEDVLLFEWIVVVLFQ